MAEEFQECEVMFQQEHAEGKHINQGGNDFNYRGFKNSSRGSKRKKLERTENTAKSSLPLKIPDGNRWFEYVESGVCNQDYDRDELVPPHLIIRQRRLARGEMMAFSVCIGKGRTLKGRELKQVRNSVLRMTGFLES